ncbi:hypothetical protein FRC18_005246, partial [Serendipita sp. 400]
VFKISGSIFKQKTASLLGVGPIPRRSGLEMISILLYMASGISDVLHLEVWHSTFVRAYGRRSSHSPHSDHCTVET